jgi:hypothetical protein
MYRCDEVSVGELPSYQAPIISDIAIEITNDGDEKGYADAFISFKTDIPSLCEVHYNLSQSTEEIPQPCDPFGMWQTQETEVGTAHTIALPPATLYYSREVRKEYCFVIVARNALYPRIHEAEGYSETQGFSLPHDVGHE